MMDNSIFGELYYEDGWNGNTTLDWFGNNINVDILISSDDDIDILQYESYKVFKNEWINIENKIINEIFSYYINLRDELGYRDNSNEDYPEITSVKDIKDKIGLDTLYIPMSGIYNGRSIGLAFHCNWDDENGVGIILVNEEIYEIGYQDIIF